MTEESANPDETSKGKEKEKGVKQDEDDTQDDTESAADSETEDEDDEEDEEDDEDEDDDEPKLKYARLTGQLTPVYRNGDATSSFLVAGDKMLIGTHNGNIHILSLPSFESLRVYSAHSASVTSISISPFPPLPSALPVGIQRIASQTQPAKRTPSVTSETSTKNPRAPKPQAIPNIPSNAIYIATSSIDGKVCVVSLVDMKDVQLRNFARPVQAVALSPDYKNDRTYVSGGLAGNLVLTVGGRSGASATSTTVGTASATASGWLGSIGLGGNSGQDTILHSGEGTISTIKWSLSGKYVVWVNEHGVRIMRSHLHLDSADASSSWKRIGHIGRPQDDGWEEMAGVWKARVEWIDEAALETDEDDKVRENAVSTPASTPATVRLKQQSKSSKRTEKLIIGWGGTVWIINVHQEGTGVGTNTKEWTAGRAEIIKILRMDCIISGLSLYTPTLLLVLAYMPPNEEKMGDEEEKGKGKDSVQKGHKSQSSTGSEPRGGIRHRANALSPELRLIDLRSSEEVDTDQLTVSRFERLSASDYHLGVLPAANSLPVARTPRGTLETLTGMGSSLWNATISATTLLNSNASVYSSGSNSEQGSTRAYSSVAGQGLNGTGRGNPVHLHLAASGMKVFIHSPYDCILATKRDLSDHLSFLLEHHKYQQSWELIDDSPDVISTSPQKLVEIGPVSSDHPQEAKDDFYDDITSAGDSASRLINSSVEKEKRRIGELWIQQLVEQGDWVTAGNVCGKVLGTSSQWKEWVYTFAAAKKFDEIVNFIPSTQLHPPLDSTVYEVVLGYYITHDRPRARQLLEHWSPDLFDIRSVTAILENQLKYRDVREDSMEHGETGYDWRIIIESLAKLYVADGRPREALKYYIKLRDADMVMSLIKDYHLVDAVADDIPSFILLRVTSEQKRTAPTEELHETTTEAINLLVSEARHGLIQPSIVIGQLQEKKLPLYLFFYLRSLWKGDAIGEQNLETHDRLVAESKTLVDEFADLAVHLFSLYDRDLLMEFLKSSTYYTFEKATAECEDNDYIPELVYLYSKTGQTKRALYLIIDRLADVSQAISFAKEQDDVDLWEDLLDYSMDKPRFIRGLLEEVGTSIDPITLVRRIPEGLAIEGLKDGLSRMIKEYELQHSIGYGVAKVLRSEVRLVQNTLRSGQRKGVKFDVHEQEHTKVLNVSDEADISVPPNPTPVENTKKEPQSGHCVGCHEPFTEREIETLVGFACGHVFHLSHLLSFNNDDRPVTPPDIDLDENGEIAMTYSIGAKVTHARLLKDRIKDGCPVCIAEAKL